MIFVSSATMIYVVDLNLKCSCCFENTKLIGAVFFIDNPKKVSKALKASL